MTKSELKAREAEIRANDIAEANREANREKAISKLMVAGMRLQDAQREFNDRVSYFLRGTLRTEADRQYAIGEAANDILADDDDDLDETYMTMLDLVHG